VAMKIGTRQTWESRAGEMRLRHGPGTARHGPCLANIVAKINHHLAELLQGELKRFFSNIVAKIDQHLAALWQRELMVN
jgi:hypothetical protein